jgi:hypothetical protein
MRKYAVPVLAVSLLMLALPARAATTCDQRLANNVYVCDVKSDDLPFLASLAFQESPFQVLVSGVGLLNCICDPQGTFNNPKFNQDASRWTCLGSDPSGAALLIRGRVSPHGKLTKVTGMISAEDEAASLLADCDIAAM